jgi:hypothetical protein
VNASAAWRRFTELTSIRRLSKGVSSAVNVTGTEPPGSESAYSVGKSAPYANQINVKLSYLTLPRRVPNIHRYIGITALHERSLHGIGHVVLPVDVAPKN